MWTLYWISLFALLCLATSSDVVVLDTKNFEHLTQASTGATTGDWLIKFYAPWCGHCKKLEPVYESVATSLAGEVNVAKVDVSANRELGTRFEIKGFPTLKFFSKGKVYTFKGRRSEEEIIEFVKGGYQIQSAEEVHPPLGFFGEIAFVYRHAYKSASADLRSGKIFTINVFLTFMPLLFVGLILLLILAPSPEPPRRKRVPVQSSTDNGDSDAATAEPSASNNDDKTD